MTKQLKGFFLPLLVGAYPVLFLYSSNAKVLYWRNIIDPLLAALAAALLGYALFYFFQRRTASASVSAAVFMALFALYGVFYQWLQNFSLFPLDHWLLLPLIILLACALGYLVSRIPQKTAASIQTILLVVASGLICFNILSVTPTEVRKARLQGAEKQIPVTSAGKPSAANPKQPDIYYIIFDEYAGFDAIRGYWHESYVDDFETLLEENDFFVARNSHSKTTSTLIELNSRLNLKYPLLTDPIVQFEDITDNTLFQTVKTYGYTTVVINKGFPPFHADYHFTYPETGFEGLAAGEFRQLLLKNSMLVAFEHLLQNNQTKNLQQRDAVIEAVNKTTDLADIPSPKFVFVYVQFPHWPFLVDRDGRLIDAKGHYNWNYYLGQHQYATKLAMGLIDRLMEEADPQNPPVIILQSDHGARNVALPSGENVTLKNYPREYQTLILNALYLPGFDTTNLPADLSPLRALEIVVEHYLKTPTGAAPGR